jgi:hypothetical protein
MFAVTTIYGVCLIDSARVEQLSPTVPSTHATQRGLVIHSCLATNAGRQPNGNALLRERMQHTLRLLLKSRRLCR